MEKNEHHHYDDYSIEHVTLQPEYKAIEGRLKDTANYDKNS